ncbi:ParE-like toxin of type II toxin-antitoxin system [Alkalispirochaeta americana]|uniref:ParE-like toxin of type II toxin-antitoxin system n=1 Tax=Alkalispirochaeta americana TaxID=159291 RepID=A0A1N6RU23_9SPIO|nr:ParE-like toxin of type II toxin-antitoxin system [Alkalispirochaeta americana]
MNWEVRQTRRFVRVYKKLHKSLCADVNQAISDISANPDIGVQKKGDLSDLWVHRFRSSGQVYLLAYTREDCLRLIYLEALGPHENFYRDMKR